LEARGSSTKVDPVPHQAVEYLDPSMRLVVNETCRETERQRGDDECIRAMTANTSAGECQALVKFATCHLLEVIRAGRKPAEICD
jgi:hypothetical protein